jgi:Ca2+-binding EF-hand superfamily protein
MLLRRIEPTLNDDEIELAFKKFDKDGDRNITFNEFCDTLKYYE